MLQRVRPRISVRTQLCSYTQICAQQQRQIHATRCSYFPRPKKVTSMNKRKAASGVEGDKTTKRAKPEIPEYHLATSIKEEDGSIQWPAPKLAMQRAREIIREAAQSAKTILILPDKDADGLSAGSILRHTLLLLGAPKNLVHTHLIKKGNNVHSEAERAAMLAYHPDYIFVIDQGSRPGPPLIDAEHKGLIIDHHHALPTDFPAGSEHVTACDSPPVATSALLTYELCRTLHDQVAERCDWLCVVGTHGDLGNTIKWEAPFPDMKVTLKKYTKKTLNAVVSLVNAPRRTATYDVQSAWDALCDTDNPSTVLTAARLLQAREEVNAEVERCTHTAPKFTADGRVAVFRINSEAQVHPVIATRWAGHLNSKALEIVMVANEGYLPGKVNFSCRVARCAKSRDPPVDIIQELKNYASLPEPIHSDDSGETPQQSGDDRKSLLQRLGNDFARGHVQASGGIVATDEFEELMQRMQVGVKKSRDGESPTKAKKSIDVSQTNTLTNYFGKKN